MSKKLPQECIDQIELVCDEKSLSSYQYINFIEGCEEALTNPLIYHKAGLTKTSEKKKEDLYNLLKEKYGDKFAIVEIPEPKISHVTLLYGAELLKAVGICWKAVDISKLSDEEIDFIHNTVKNAST